MAGSVGENSLFLGFAGSPAFWLKVEGGSPCMAPHPSPGMSQLFKFREKASSGFGGIFWPG